jgi:Fibronectin type III domain
MKIRSTFISRPVRPIMDKVLALLTPTATPRHRLNRLTTADLLKSLIVLFMAVACFLASAQARQVTLVWDANTNDVDGYRLHYGTRSGSYTRQLDVGLATTATVTGLTDATTYFFVINAYNASGESPPSNEVSDDPNATPTPPPTPTPTPPPTPTPTPTSTPTPTPAGPPPAAPSNLVATAMSSSQIVLSWRDNSTREDGFQIQRSRDGVDFTLIASRGANVTTFTDNGRMAGTTYYYRVRAFNAGGNSELSNIARATTRP